MNASDAGVPEASTREMQSVEGSSVSLVITRFCGLTALIIMIAVLDSIQRDWDFMTDSECIPVHVALSLMDTSTLGKADREPDFLHMYNEIQKTLKAIVNGESTSSGQSRRY
jgi:hypothetical protein